MRNMPFLYQPAVQGAGGREDPAPAADGEAPGGGGTSVAESAGAAMGRVYAGYQACGVWGVRPCP